MRAAPLLLLITVLQGRPVGATGYGESLRVHIYDYIGIPQATLAAALQHAGATLHRQPTASGIDPLWELCRHGSEPMSQHACPAAHAPASVSINIVAAARALHPRLPVGTVGLTLGSHDGIARVAYIFHSAIAALARRSGAAHTAEVLGFAIAHEVGHLLGLPHTQRGIMREKWFSRGIAIRAGADFQFTEREVAAMQRNLGARSGEPRHPRETVLASASLPSPPTHSSKAAPAQQPARSP